MEVADCSIVLNAFNVNARAAQQLLDGSDITVARVLPGKASLLLMGVDYRDNPLGDYNEAAILISAYPQREAKGTWMKGAFLGVQMRVPYFVYRMPVDQEFTTHAGRFLWGYPKYLADIAVEFQDQRASTHLSHHGEHICSFQAPAVSTKARDQHEGRRLSNRVGCNLTLRNGQLRRITATMGGRGFAFRLGGTPPELGEHHPLAQDLRKLGLPKRPILSASLAHATMTFGVPEEI